MFQKYDGTQVDYPGLTSSVNYDYNLTNLYGASVQAVYTKIGVPALSFVIQLQCSNDGENWFDLSGKTVSISATGSILWDLGVTTYRILRVKVTATSGTMDLSLIFNGINLD